MTQLADRLTVSDVARELGITPARVRQLANDGRIECEMTPLGRLFDRAEVDRVVAERERVATEREQREG